jgi:hypothetical protein
MDFSGLSINLSKSILIEIEEWKEACKYRRKKTKAICRKCGIRKIRG